MRPEEQNVPGGSDHQHRRRFELFFFELVGTRYHLRFTRLALILIVCLTVIPMVAICALFFTESHADLENVNINIRSQSQAPGNHVRLIIQPPAPMPTLPKVGRSQRGGEPARQTPAAPGVNANAPPTPSPTPSPTPPRPPS
ncbi:MAG TPA: hypothetical protein VGB98_18160 [Pyrinomonadaceae bacterium]|jgi:hypothetical protein